LGLALRRLLGHFKGNSGRLIPLALLGWTLPLGVLASPPAITVQPQPRTVVEGTNYTFTVAATGSSPLAYQWWRDSSSLAGKTNSFLLLAMIQTNDAGVYTVVVTNLEGSMTSAPARLTVRLASDPVYPAPPGGWAYVFQGSAVASSLTAALDGTWDHQNDSWSGDGRGAGNGLPGGVSTTNGIITIEDAVTSGTGFNNRRYYFTHSLAQESSVANATTLLDDGVTLTFRARLTPPSDPLIELPNAPNGLVNNSDGKGMFGIRQAGNGGGIIGFSLNQSSEDASTTASFDFGRPGLHMNNLNGNARSANVDPGEGGTTNLLALDPTVFHEFWITIQDNGADPGTHRVSIYSDGSKRPTVFNLTAGLGVDGPATNYLALGMGSSAQRGAVDVDFFGYRAGVAEPSAFNEPLGFSFAPPNQYVATGQVARFSVGVTGTPPYSLQWYRDGTAISGATNLLYVTPPVTASDEGAQFTVVVTNESLSLTSSPPAVLHLLNPPVITASPNSLTVTNGDSASLAVAADSGIPPSYQWRFNGDNLSNQTNAVLVLAGVSPANAGHYDVVVANPSGSVTSALATLTVILFDFGDAPDPGFPSLKASNGARHVIVPGIHLGASIDAEVDGQPDADAMGDDLNGNADEDGVRFLTPLFIGQTTTLEVVASTNGLLSAWVDFNRDNSWSGGGEQVFTNQALAAGTNTLRLIVPGLASTGLTHARFRFSTAGGLSFNGPAADGEVEDYALTIAALADLSVTQTSSPEPVAVNSNLTYSITVSNAGPSAASGATLTDSFPAGVTFVSATSSPGGCNQSDGILTCSLGALNNGAAARITLVVKVTAAGSIANTVSVSSPEVDLVPANNTFTSLTSALDAPAITVPPQSLTVTNGSTANFSVTASGTPPLRFQWRFNESDLDGQTNATLSIFNAQPANAGNYAVRVANQVGAIDSPVVTLAVLVPVNITASPQSQTVNVGATVLFSVAATGSAPLTFQWSFNDSDLIGETNATLVLTNVQLSQAGLYRARVSNALGPVTSNPASLTVFAPPSFTLQPESRTNFAGGTATFNALATGTAPVRYQWYVNQTNLLSGQTNTSLVLANLQPAQSGGYAVVATNLAGTTTSLVAVLTVFEMDFGDAPDALGYPTTMAFNGARHRILPGVHLGAAVDFEPDGQPNGSATGDDFSGSDDEDGVGFTSPWLVGQFATVLVVASTNGFLDAWIDFDANGTWADPGEQALASQAVVAGANLVMLPISPTARPTNTFARFRFSRAGGLSFDGFAPDGEVEDYAVTIRPAIDLAVTVIDSVDPVPVLSNVTYTVVVTNQGPSPATGVVLTNTLPASLTLLSVIPSQGSCNNAGGRVICALGSLENGGSATVNLTLRADVAGTFVANAAVTGNEAEADSPDNTGFQTTSVIVPPVAFSNVTAIPIADATAAGPGVGNPYPSTIVVSGLTGLVYKVTATLNNLSHSFAGDLDILLVGPSGQAVLLMSDAAAGFVVNGVTLTFDDAAGLSLPTVGVLSSTGYRPTNYDPSLDTFPPPAPLGPFGSALSVFQGTDPNGPWSLYLVDDLPNNTGIIGGGWRLNISTADPIADLAVLATASSNPVAVNSNLVYAITVTNRGPAAATGVTLTNALPAGVNFVSVTSSQGACLRQGGLVTCDFGQLTPGAAAVATVTVTPFGVGVFTNSATARGAQLDLVTNNNFAQAITAARPLSDLLLAQTVSANFAPVGQPLTYTLNVTNRGPNAANNVRLTDALPEGVILLAAAASQGSCTNAGGKVTCGLGNLAANARAQVMLVVQATVPGSITNSAIVASDEVDPFGTNNTSSVVAVTEVQLAPAILTAPQSQRVTNGAEVTFLASASGTPPLAYQWQFNGTDLPGATSVSLTLSNVTSASAGSYRLRVSNSVGSVFSAPALLTVLAPPFLSNIPDQQTDEDVATPSVQFTVGDVDSSADELVLTASSSNPALVPPNLIALGGTGVSRTVQITPAANQSGNATITIQVRDRDNLLAVDSFLLTVRPVNDRPTLAPIEDLTLPVSAGRQTVGLSNITAGAANESQLLTVTAISSNPALVPNPSVNYTNPATTGSLSFTLAPGNGGLATITVTVNDGEAVDGTVSRNFTVRINALTTRQPTISDIPDQVTPEDTAIDLAFTVSDVETPAQNLMLRMFSSNPALVSETDAAFSGTGTIRALHLLPAADQFGTAAITLRVTDDEGLSADSSFLLAVNPVNDPPTLAQPLDITLGSDAGPQTIPLLGLGSGAPNEIQILSLTAVSSDPSLIPNPTIAYLNPQPSGTLTITPAAKAVGAATITLTVDDGQAANHTTSRSFVVTVNPVRSVPVISPIADQSTEEDTPRSIPFTVADDTTPASALLLSIRSSDTNLFPAGSMAFGGSGSNRTVTVTPSLNRFGLASLTLTVTDTNQTSSSQSFALTVNPVNDRPVISHVLNQSVNEDANGLTLAFTVGDVETPAGSLIVTGDSSNPDLLPGRNLLFGGSESNRTVTLIPLPDQSGVATIRITLRDAGGLTASDSFVLTVNAVNDPPTLSPLADQTISEDVPLTLAFAVGDPETPVAGLLLSASSSNPSLVPNANIVFSGSLASPWVTITPATNQSGAATIALVVSDANGASTTNRFQLTVVAVNDPPTLAPLGNLVLGEDAGPQTVFLSGISSGASDENEFLTVTASVNDTNLIRNLSVSYSSPNPTGSLGFLPAPNASGATRITVTVKDGSASNNITTRAFNVVINPGNDPPTISDILNQTMNEDTTLTVPFTINDVETPPFQLVVTGTSTNTTLVANTNILINGDGTNRFVRLTPSRDQFGTTLITLTVNDGLATASDSFLLTVSPVNDPPTLNPLTDVVYSGNPSTQTIPLSGISSGAANENETLVVTASSSNTSLIPTPTVSYTSPSPSGSITFNPANGAVGRAVITVTVTGANNTSISRSFSAYFRSTANVAPTLSGLSNQAINEDTVAGPISFTVGDSVTPANLLTVAGTSSNTNLVPGSNIVFGGSGTSRTVTVTPSLNQSGSAAITVSVTDTNFGYTTNIFIVTVNPLNDSPLISGLQDQVSGEDTATAVIPFTVSDVETPAGSLTIAALSTNAALVPNANIVFGGSGTNRALVVTPATNQFGTTLITVTVNDNSGGSTARSFLLTVIPTNDPPILSDITSQVIDEDGSTGPLFFTISDTETPASSLSLAVASSNPSLIPTNNLVLGGSGNNRTLTVTPLPDRSGTATITLTVTDGNSASVSNSFSVTVLAVNDAPTLNPISNLTLNQGAGAQLVNLTGIGSGAPDEDQALVVTASSSHSGLIPTPSVTYSSPDSVGSLSFTPVPSASGTATLTVTVNDGGARNHTSSRTFTVTINGAPSISQIADQVVDEDTPTAAIPIVVSDLETVATALTLTAASSNTNLVPNSNLVLGGSGTNRTLTIQPATNQSGNATITVTVTDGSGHTASDSFELVVNPVNDPPTLGPLSDLTFDPSAGLQIVNLRGITAGATNETQDLVLRAVSSNPALIPSPALNYTSPGTNGMLSLVPTAGARGDTLITVVVSDGQSLNGSSTQTFHVTLVGTNSGPALSVIADQTTDEDTPLVVGFTTADTVTPGAVLSVAARSSNLNLVPDANLLVGGNDGNRALLMTPAPDQFGSAIITVTATNGNQAVVTRSFRLTVNPVNDRPVLSRIANQTINQNTSTTVLAFTVTDVETPAESLSVVPSSSNPFLVPASGLVLNGTGTNRTLIVTPVTNQFGSALITLTASDPNGGVSGRNFRLTVTQPRPAPIITAIARPGGTASVSFTTQTGLSYRVEFQDTIGAASWNGLLPIAGTGGLVTVLDPAASSPARFYRVRVE